MANRRMEVLRWTGSPRMALINLIGTGDHVARWRAALGRCRGGHRRRRRGACRGGDDDGGGAEGGHLPLRIGQRPVLQRLTQQLDDLSC